MLTDIQKHKSVMARLLKDILRDSKLKTHLGFKGGTSLYLLEGLPRFSTDLDFDLIKKTDIKDIHQLTASICEKHGKLMDSKIKRNTILNVISYKTEERNVKVEINLKEFGSHYKKREWLNLPMNVMVKEDQFAHKICALVDRPAVAGRDLFDIGFMFEKGWSINSQIVKKRTGKNISTLFTRDILPIVRETKVSVIMDNIGELLADSPKEVESWVRNSLKEDIEFHILQRYKT